MPARHMGRDPRHHWSHSMFRRAHGRKRIERDPSYGITAVLRFVVFEVR